MQIKEFYKELYSKLKEILKPYGFRKKGDRFRSLLDNGIAYRKMTCRIFVGMT